MKRIFEIEGRFGNLVHSKSIERALEQNFPGLFKVTELPDNDGEYREHECDKLTPQPDRIELVQEDNDLRDPRVIMGIFNKLINHINRGSKQ